MWHCEHFVSLLGHLCHLVHYLTVQQVISSAPVKASDWSSLCGATTEGTTTICSLLASHWFPVMWENKKPWLLPLWSLIRSVTHCSGPQGASFYSFWAHWFFCETKQNIDCLTQKGRSRFSGGNKKTHTQLRTPLMAKFPFKTQIKCKWILKWRENNNIISQHLVFLSNVNPLSVLILSECEMNANAEKISMKYF